MKPTAPAKAAAKAIFCNRIAFLLSSTRRNRAFVSSGLRQPPKTSRLNTAVRKVRAEYAPSVREGPHPKFLFCDLPEPRQAVRLDNKEENDEGADNHELQMLDCC